MPTMQLPTDYVVSSPEKTPFERQAVEAPGTKKPGQTGALSVSPSVWD